MNELTNKIIEINFDDISDYNFPKNERFGLIIWINNVKYEFLITINSLSEKVLVLGSGALSQTNNSHDRSRPLFNRQSWNFEETTIFFNDPTLYINDELLAPWGVGTEDDWYLENIAKIIKEITINLEISNNNILFYGSSAGGFTSLLLSILIKDSYALAEIPQLNLKKHWPGHYLLLIKHCFNNLSESQVVEKFSHRLDVIELMKKEKYVPNAFLLMDFSVKPDVDMHYIPFFEELDNICENIKNKIHIIIKWGYAGHHAQSYDESIQSIKWVEKHMDTN